MAGAVELGRLQARRAPNLKHKSQAKAIRSRPAPPTPRAGCGQWSLKSARRPVQRCGQTFSRRREDGLRWKRWDLIHRSMSGFAMRWKAGCDFPRQRLKSQIPTSPLARPPEPPASARGRCEKNGSRVIVQKSSPRELDPAKQEVFIKRRKALSIRPDFGFSRRSGRKRIKTSPAQVSGLAGPQVSGGQISRGTVWRRSGFEAGEFDAFRNVVAELELELFYDAASGRG